MKRLLRPGAGGAERRTPDLAYPESTQLLHP